MKNCTSIDQSKVLTEWDEFCKSMNEKIKRVIMKNCTSIEQSKKLAEILPLESADMCYSNDGTAIKIDANSYLVRKKMWKDIEVIPCWSLAALLENIPVYLTKEDKTLRLQIDMGLDDFDIWYEESGLVVSELDCISEDFVDACVEMIDKLNKEKLL